MPILTFDVLVLGSQHVIATYTRLCFDRISFREHRFLVLGVPWLVLLGVLAVFTNGGTVAVTSLYIYWQWFHYVGQGVAVERMYAYKAGSTESSVDWVALLAMYGVPLFGLLHRSMQKRLHPEQVYLTFDFYPLPVTQSLVTFCGILAATFCVVWIFRQAYHIRTFSLPHTAYVVTHWVIFLTGYYLIDDITFGWLVINVWHNLQYVFLVWIYNNNRFKRGVDPDARVLSFLSQTRFIWLYFTVCLVLSGIFYKLVAVVDGLVLEKFLANQDLILNMDPAFFQSSGLASLNLVPNSSSLAAAIAMLSYQVINMHHYIVDALIWRVDKKEHHVGLGLAE